MLRTYHTSSASTLSYQANRNQRYAVASFCWWDRISLLSVHFTLKEQMAWVSGPSVATHYRFLRFSFKLASWPIMFSAFSSSVALPTNLTSSCNHAQWQWAISNVSHKYWHLFLTDVQQVCLFKSKLVEVLMHLLLLCQSSVGVQ